MRQAQKACYDHQLLDYEKHFIEVSPKWSLLQLLYVDVSYLFEVQ